VHWPSGATISGKRKGAVVPLEETLGALDSLRHRGLIGAIGLCNFSVDEVQAALRCTRVESVQCSYSLLWRQPQRGLLDLCAREGLAFLAYSPLAQGLIVRAPPGDLPPWDMRMRHRLARGSKRAAVREARLRLEAPGGRARDVRGRHRHRLVGVPARRVPCGRLGQRCTRARQRAQRGRASIRGGAGQGRRPDD